MRALYINNSAPISMQRCFAPRTSRTSPPDLSVPCAAVESEPVSAYIDTHLALLAEAVGRKAIYPGTDEAN